MATQSLTPTIYGATQTTTFTTTATGTVSQVLFFAFPTLTTSQPLSYTTLPSPTDPNSKQFPDGLPILVVTEVDGVIVNPSGQTISTATIVQAPPASPTSTLTPTSTTPSGTVGTVFPAQPQPSSGWVVWSAGQKAGVVIAGVVSGLGLLAALWYVCAASRKRKRLERDMEKGPSGGGAGERKRGKRSETKKKRKASAPDEGPGGIEGIEGVEMGPAARRSLQGETSTAMARKSGEPRASRRSADPRASRGTRREEGVASAPVGEARGVARGGAAAPLPVGQRPLHPPTPNQRSRVEGGGRDLINRAGPSVVPVRMEAGDVEKAPAPHNALVDDDDSDDMEHVYPHPPPPTSKAGKRRLGIE